MRKTWKKKLYPFPTQSFYQLLSKRRSLSVNTFHWSSVTISGSFAKEAAFRITTGATPDLPTPCFCPSPAPYLGATTKSNWGNCELREVRDNTVPLPLSGDTETKAHKGKGYMKDSKNQTRACSVLGVKSPRPGSQAHYKFPL